MNFWTLKANFIGEETLRRFGEISTLFSGGLLRISRRMDAKFLRSVRNSVSKLEILRRANFLLYNWSRRRINLVDWDIVISDVKCVDLGCTG